MSLRTVYLGQFEREHAERIAHALEEAGIAWTYKQFGRMARLLFAEWGVRMYVDASRTQEVKAILAKLDQPANPGEA